MFRYPVTQRQFVSDSASLQLAISCAIMCTLLVLVYAMNIRLWGLTDKFSHIAFFAGLFIVSERLRLFSRASIAGLLGAFAVLIEIVQGRFYQSSSALLNQSDASFADLIFSCIGILVGWLVLQIQPTSRRRSAAMWIFIIVIAVSFDIFYSKIRSITIETLLTRTEQRAVLQETRLKPWIGAPASVFGHLELPTIGKRVLLLDNASPGALSIKPGVWSFSSAEMPNLTIILGHRNREFFDLALLERGDQVVLNPIGAPAERFSISKKSIVNANSSGIFPLKGERGLLLITCWPVDQIAPTNERLVIHLDLVLTDAMGAPILQLD